MCLFSCLFGNSLGLSSQCCQKWGVQKEIKRGGWSYRGGTDNRRGGFKTSAQYDHDLCV